MRDQTLSDHKTVWRAGFYWCLDGELSPRLNLTQTWRTVGRPDAAITGVNEAAGLQTQWQMNAGVSKQSVLLFQR